MTVAWVGAGIGAAGIAAGLYGSSRAARGASQAADAELQAARDANLNAQMRRLERFQTMLGAEQGLAQWKALTPQPIRDEVLGVRATPAQQAQLDDLERQIREIEESDSGTRRRRRSELDRLKRQRDDLTEEVGAFEGLMDEDQIRKQGPGLQQDYEAIAKQAAEANRSNLETYDAETAGLLQQSRDIEGQAKRFGEQQIENLNTDAAREQASLDRKATGALMARGIGAGSSMTDALAGNSDQVMRAKNAALANIQNQQIGMRTGLATGSLGMAAGRAGGRTGLLQGGQETERGLRIGALNTKQAALTSETPYYQSSASPGGAANMAMGSSIAGLASPMAGYGFRTWMDSLRTPTPPQSLTNNSGVHGPPIELRGE